MAERHEGEEEMSMEEILSSIRKYVIDEKGPTGAAAAPQMSTDSYDNEGVIELNHPLEDSPPRPKKVAQSPATPVAAITPAASPVVTPILAAAPKQQPLTSPQSATRAANVQPAPTKKQTHTPFQAAQYPFHPLPAAAPQQEPKADESIDANKTAGIVSPKTAFDTAQAFSRLAEAAEQPSVYQKPLLTGDTTIEQLITEVTKPIIKTWLDQNLTPIVEAMVAKEIARITQR